MNTLFRAEAIDHQRQKLHGAILLTHSRAASALVLLLGVCMALLAAFSYVAGFARELTLPGVVLPDLGLIPVIATQSGTVSELPIHEGMHVDPGDLLLVIDSERRSKSGDMAQRVDQALALQVSSLHRERIQLAEQTEIRERSIRQDVASSSLSIARLKKQVALQRRRAAVAQDTFRRMRALTDSSSSLVSVVTLNEKEAEALEQRLRLGDLTRELDALKAQRATKHLQMSELEVQHRRDVDELKRRVAGLEQESAENEVRGRVEVRAPRASRITAVSVTAGEAVNAEQPVLRMVPDHSTLEVVLYAPTRAVGFLYPGMPVQIRYAAYPYQKYGQFPGTVREVSAGPMLRDEVSQWLSATESDEPVYRVRVSVPTGSLLIDGRTSELRPGMLLEASVQLEYRKLYEWIVEPLVPSRQSARPG